MHSNTAMMVRADARAVGMVTATRVGGGNKQPRTYTRASACISYFSQDKSDAVIFRSARAERRATRRTGSATVAKRETLTDAAFNYTAPTTAADLRPILAD